jgi:hypothetical protein
MFERFTQQARQVIVFAQEEARGLRHSYIGTEHELLGLVREREGIAAQVLDGLGISESRVREDITRIVGAGERLPDGQIPFTSRAMAALKSADAERLTLGHDEIETEHILLGLLRGDGGIALRVLADSGLARGRVRAEVLRMLNAHPSRHRALPIITPMTVARPGAVGPKLVEVSAQQAESFAVLRRPQRQSDRLPESRWEAFEVGMRARRGLNPALARRVITPAGDVWVVPGNGHISLAVDGGTTCNRTEHAARRGMVTWTSRRSTGQGIVHGLVPDGVEEVTLNTATDTSTTIRIDENVYGAVLDGHFRSLRFSGLAGTVELGPFS